MYEYTPPPVSYYEYSVKEERKNTERQFKEAALSAMKQLEGWCSENKAATLIDLVYLVRPKKIVEIGVFGGKSLVPMAFALKALNEGGIAYGIDPWEATASAEGQDGVNEAYWSGINHGEILSNLNWKIGQFQLNDQIKLIQATSAGAPPIYGIDILHIDGNHSDEASYFDTLKWVPFVRRGGLIIFDDITWSTIDRALKWINVHCIKLFEVEDESNSWGVWVKP